MSERNSQRSQRFESFVALQNASSNKQTLSNEQMSLYSIFINIQISNWNENIHKLYPVFSPFESYDNKGMIRKKHFFLIII